MLVVCSLVGMGQHWIEEWYAGRPVFRIRMGILLALVVMNLVLKWVFYPSMTQQHLKAYRPSATQQDLQEGSRAYRMWKTGFHFVHLFVVIGSFYHLWHVSQRQSNYRELGVYQFRG